jgi:endonuclease/exonuclease/phosphatase family metal-dependent hydrolase
MVFGNIISKHLLIFGMMCAFCTISCAQTPQKTLTLATFNMEWLGDNTSDDRKIRSQQDLVLLANVIRDTKADILAMQEVENAQAMKLLLGYLPEYSFVLGETGGKQHVGFLYKQSLAQAGIRIIPRGEVQAVAVEKDRTRAALQADILFDNTVFHLLTVHLKASSRADSTPELLQRSYDIRRRQAAQLLAWCDSVQKQQAQANIVILGDFNDAPSKKNTTLDTLKTSPNLVFLTADAQSCTFENLPAIDHILCSTQAIKRIAQGSLYTLNLRKMLKEQEAERVSDHCPVVVQITLNE